MSAARGIVFSADGQAFTGAGTYAGIQVVEGAASTAEVRVYDGTSNAGVLLDVVKLTSGTIGVGHGIDVWFSTGLYVDVVSGTVAGRVYVR